MEKRGMKIVLALGTNVDQVQNMEKAKAMLCAAFGDMRFSSAMWTEPIGLEGSDRFLNMVAEGECSMEMEAAQNVLKQIEWRCGRRKDDAKSVEVAMDIDLLLYGDKKCHVADWERDYIQTLLKEL